MTDEGKPTISRNGGAMRRCCSSLAVLGALCVPAHGQSTDVSLRARAVLDKVVVAAGLQSTRPSIVATSELPRERSAEAEAWIVYSEDHATDRIFVYTGSRTFRCASVAHRDQYQCLLKLASVIVHEVWHLTKGPDERGAYDAQLAFLEFQQASAPVMNEVRGARRRVLADRRTPGKAVDIRAGLF
jgi:hypothetical protein